MRRNVGVVTMFVMTLALDTAWPDTAAGQINTGEIAGDHSGAVLPGASVTASHLMSGTVVERLTDDDGRFFLPALRLGAWDVSARLPGFTTQTHRNVVLEVGRAVTLDFSLGVQGPTEEIVVQAAA